MNVLFVCRSNAERSQVAQLLFNKTSKKNNANSAGLALVDFEKGLPPGRIMTELMLSQGYENFTKQHRKQLTEEMARKADLIIVIIGRDEAKKYVPEYLKKIGVSYWYIGGNKMPYEVFSKWPPITYKYHIKWVLEIQKKVDELVDKIG